MLFISSNLWRVTGYFEPTMIDVVTLSIRFPHLCPDFTPLILVTLHSSMAPKSKANGAGAKPEKSVPSTSGTATPITDAPSSGALTKPDKAAYDAEQDSLRKQIDAIQTKLVRYPLYWER
jgi:hypothetical protein